MNLTTTETELLARLVAAMHPPPAKVDVRAIAELDENALPEGTIVFAISEPGASHAELAARIEARAYVTRARLVASEILARGGGIVSLPPVDARTAREVLVIEPRSELARAEVLPGDLESDVFSIDAYAALLRRALEAGYRFIGFEEALALPTDSNERVILLRHDIDLSPRLSLRVAEVEAAASVQSTFFYMLSGAFYDLLEPEHRQVVRRVSELGHELGFHYDEYDDIADGLEILSVVAGRKLRHIAQHNPTLLPRRGLEGRDVVDAYDPRIGGAQRFVYVSDSGMRWRAKSFADLLDERAPRIYALCHPESWLTEGRDMIAMIRGVEADETARRRKRYDAFIEGNIRYLRTRREREGR